MREFGFEVALCAWLERHSSGIPSRQLGASSRGNRVIDIAAIEPGPDFEDRTAISSRTIPDRAIRSSVGVGRWRHWKEAFASDSEWVREACEAAIGMGFFERTRRGGREYVRQTARYPAEWFGSIIGIENKPDLSSPGDLDRQLRIDVSLGLFDEVILATETYVTRAHLNRLPAEVGVWRFDPESANREVIREPTPLDPTEYGVEVSERAPGRTDIEIVPPVRKARLRRRLAERAYGKGWRTYAFPACAQVEARESAGTASLPYCQWKNRVVHPATECGSDCPGHEPAESPVVDSETERERRTPWVREPDGRARRQVGLDRFG
ncbi:hypothetical protein BRC86_04275 [Halobacteriales archaeon QS_3_64_16]|nr:MAG: hypothetical protein BRC86_04275 [Halobacteriales archaeon QS_3_64_16]